MFDLVTYPAEILKTRTKEVTIFDDELEFFAKQMFKTMYHHRGIGLAANQVGLNKRMLVMDCGNNPLVIVNPFIFNVSEKLVKMEEGCLSFPGFLVEVERPDKIQIEYQDLAGRFHGKEFEGVEARCVQHEIDHLDGTTFLKHISSFHRKMIEKSLK